jgi:bla regulator protein BlaR1
MTQVFEKILEVSIQASVLAILILIARNIVIKRSNFFMNILFALLIIRLIVPISIQSPLSIQNIFSTSNVTKVGLAIIDDITQVEGSIAPTKHISFDNTSQVGDTSISLSQNANPLSPIDKRQNLSIIDIVSMIWLFGVVLLTACIVINNILFRLKLKKNRAYDDESFLRLMTECKETLGVKQNIPAIQANNINLSLIHI